MAVNYELLGNYLAEQLTDFRPNFYEIDTGEFWALDPNMNMITRNADMHIATEEIAFFTRKYFGSAAIYDGKGSDIPIVSHQTAIGKIPAVVLINGSEWNIFDLERENKANASGLFVPRQSLTTLNYRGMADFLNRREHYITLYGVSSRGVYGLFNQPTPTVIDYAVNNIYDPAVVTPIDLYRLFIRWIQLFMRQAMISNSRQIEMKIPERLRVRLTEPYSNEAPTMTVMELLQDPMKGYAIGPITSCTESEGHNLSLNVEGFPANRDRIIMKSSSDAIGQDYCPRNTTPETLVNPITWQVVSYSGISSVYTPRANRVMYIDYLNS
jgi:hypothetical protein